MHTSSNLPMSSRGFGDVFYHKAITDIQHSITDKYTRHIREKLMILFVKEMNLEFRQSYERIYDIVANDLETRQIKN